MYAPRAVSPLAMKLSLLEAPAVLLKEMVGPLLTYRNTHDVRKGVPLQCLLHEIVFEGGYNTRAMTRLCPGDPSIPGT
jgi:hypothetical protein